MDLSNYILLNPSFLNNNNKSFALVSNETDINGSIKFFWNELYKKLFKLDDEINNNVINNFPLFIFDKKEFNIRQFLIDQQFTRDKIQLKYREITKENYIDKYNESLLFDYYIDSLIKNCIINLDIKNILGNSLFFPKLKQKLLLKF